MEQKQREREQSERDFQKEQSDFEQERDQAWREQREQREQRERERREQKEQRERERFEVPFNCAAEYNLLDNPPYHQDFSWGRRCSACDRNHDDPLTEEKIREGHGFCSANTCYDSGGPFNDEDGNPVVGRFRQALEFGTHPTTRIPMTVADLDDQLAKGDGCPDVVNRLSL